MYTQTQNTHTHTHTHTQIYIYIYIYIGNYSVAIKLWKPEFGWLIFLNLDKKEEKF